MGAPKRVRSDPTDDWQQLRLRVRFPEQETYELLRPIVLFGQSASTQAGDGRTRTDLVAESCWVR